MESKAEPNKRIRYAPPTEVLDEDPKKGLEVFASPENKIFMDSGSFGIDEKRFTIDAKAIVCINLEMELVNICSPTVAEVEDERKVAEICIALENNQYQLITIADKICCTSNDNVCESQEKERKRNSATVGKYRKFTVGEHWETPTNEPTFPKGCSLSKTGDKWQLKIKVEESKVSCGHYSLVELPIASLIGNFASKYLSGLEGSTEFKREKVEELYTMLKEKLIELDVITTKGVEKYSREQVEEMIKDLFQPYHQYKGM